MIRSNLVIGHSHVGAIRAAARIRREADPDRPRTRTIYLFDSAFGEEMDGDDFSDGVKTAIRSHIERHEPVIASAIGGNAHAAMTMIPRRRIDFVLAGDDAVPLDPEAELISEAEMRALLTHAMTFDLTRLRLLRALVGPFWHLESPPPVRRKDWIVEHAEAFFVDQPDFHRLGVAEPGIRYRAWRLAGRILREELDRLGCFYVPVPSRVCGEAGLLRPSHARDATHGTHNFGEAMLQELEARAN